jgi:hypothetical protein
MHGHKTRLSRWLGLLLLPLLLAGCGTAGNQILIFGTDTKYALDISGDTTTGQPSFTLGYKRREAVWLPLIGSGGVATHTCTGTGTSLQCVAMAGKPGGTHICDSSMNCVAVDSSMHKFVGKDGSGAEDAYSVLASFGAKNSTGERSIAQFIATGPAAVKMASKSGASLVNSDYSEYVKNLEQGTATYAKGLSTDGTTIDAEKLKAAAAKAGLDSSTTDILVKDYGGKPVDKFATEVPRLYPQLATHLLK